MKALSLFPLWAMLVAIEAKRVETRSWNTSYRGPLAIHASAGFGHGGKTGYMAMRTSEPFRSALEGHPILFGKVIAVCELVAVCEIGFDLDKFDGWEWRDATGRIRFHKLTAHERAFGDYTRGRFAWLLDHVKRLDEPVPAKGKLGLWEWDVTVTCRSDFIACHSYEVNCG